MRILAIDLGERRVGLALSDPAARIAMPLTTLRRQSDLQVIEEILVVAKREQVAKIIVGEPVRLDGSRGSAAQRSASFVRKLAARTGLPCQLVDETLTSVEAQHRLRTAGVDPRRNPARVDAVAAQILLEQHLSDVGPENDD